MTIVRLLILGTWAGSLAACSDGGGEADPVVPDSARFTALVAEAESLYFEHTPNYNEVLPVSGSATFEGAAAFATETEISDAIADIDNGDPDSDDIPPREYIILANPSMASDVTMTADFGTGSIEGRFDNFEGAAGVEIDGSLAITNGEINRDRGEFQADVGGTLIVDGVEVTHTEGPFIGMHGNFFGEGVQALAGSTATVATSAAGEEVVYGVFTAVR